MHPTHTNESGWKKDTKQKNAIHQICQKIRSNSNTVKALTNTTEDTLLKDTQHQANVFIIAAVCAVWKAMKSLFTCTFHTPPWWAAFTWCHLSESLAIIFSSHFPVCFDFAKTTVPAWARLALLHWHNSYKFWNNLASTSQRQVLVIKLQYLEKRCVCVHDITIRSEPVELKWAFHGTL